MSVLRTAIHSRVRRTLGGVGIAMNGVCSPLIAAFVGFCVLLSSATHASDGLDFWQMRHDSGALAVTTGDGVFLAVGLNGSILRSTNGLIWTPQSSANSLPLRGITYGAGTFVAVGGGEPGPGVILTSSDGIAWKVQESQLMYPLQAVVYGGGKFVAVGVAGIAMTSPDGVNWSSGPGARTSRWAITYGNRLFVSVGYSEADYGVQTSQDGVEWKAQSAAEAVPSLSQFRSITYGAGLFVAVGNDGSVISSPDATNWVRRTSGTTVLLNGIACGNGTFLATGLAGAVLTSTNAIDWVLRNTGTIGNFNGVVFHSGRFWVVGDHEILQSSDVSLPGRYASTLGSSRSFGLEVFVGSLPGVGLVTNHVTTFDGTSDLPLREPRSNGQFYYSGELRPRVDLPGVYEGDYVTEDFLGSIVQYGTFTLTLPPADHDVNGIIDCVQREYPGDALLTGEGRTDSPFVAPFTISGFATRRAGSSKGAYTLNVSALAGIASYSGNLYLPFFSGTIYYERETNNRVQFDLTYVNRAGTGVVLIGTNSVTVLNPDQVTFPRFNLVSANGETYTVMPFGLRRTGNIYAGILRLVDGDPATSWRDYVDWVLKVEDNNDSDGNGVPDFSDIIRPYLWAARVGNTLVLSWPLSGFEFALESTEKLAPNAAWSPAPDSAIVNGDKIEVALPISSGPKFFRLRR